MFAETDPVSSGLTKNQQQHSTIQSTYIQYSKSRLCELQKSVRPRIAGGRQDQRWYSRKDYSHGPPNRTGQWAVIWRRQLAREQLLDVHSAAMSRARTVFYE